MRESQVLGVRVRWGALLLALGLCLTNPAAAQDAPPGRVGPSISVRDAPDGLRLTVAPAMVGIRATLAAIAHETGFRVVNLAHVPDEPVYVSFADEPVDLAVERLLRDARVDYVARVALDRATPSEVIVVISAPPEARSAQPRGGAQPSARSVASAIEEEPSPFAVPQESAFRDDPAPGQDAGDATGQFADLPTPEPVVFPDVPPSPMSLGSATPGQVGALPQATPLDIKPQIVEIEKGPVWQPLDQGPRPVPLPPGMTAPAMVPITAPPSPGAQPTAAPNPKAPGTPPGEELRSF